MINQHEGRHYHEEGKKRPHEATGPKSGIATVDHSATKTDQDPHSNNRTQIQDKTSNVLHSGFGEAGGSPSRWFVK